jgi:transcriptional regulator with XRE-family HTH domain
MNPFANYLHTARISRGIRQTDLANILGYEQTYISALEVGKNGPPTEVFIKRLIEVFGLTVEESNVLRQTVEASKCKLTLDKDLHQDVFWMVHDLRERLPELSAVQIQLIRQILGLKDNLKQLPTEVIRPLKRRLNQEAKM